MFYDLHIHSGLSPCANDEMSPNNILSMAKLNHLGLIAITDHNSFAQQSVLSQIAKDYGIQVWYGAELTSKEDVHVLAYFEDLSSVLRLQPLIEKAYVPFINKTDFYGHQFLFDEKDVPCGEVTQFLLLALSLNLEECIQLIHKYHGKAVLAHIYGRANGIIEQLGFIPDHLNIDGIEVMHDSEIDRFKLEYPHLSHLPILMNSDAHQLKDMVKTHYPLPTSAHWFKVKV